MEVRDLIVCLCREDAAPSSVPGPLSHILIMYSAPAINRGSRPFHRYRRDPRRRPGERCHRRYSGGRAEQAIEAIREMLAPTPRCCAAGSAEASTAGRSFRRYRLLEAGEEFRQTRGFWSPKGFAFQEAILTGQSAPVEGDGPVAVEAVLGDRSCMAFSGTIVVGGCGPGSWWPQVNHRNRPDQRPALQGGDVTTPLIRQMDNSPGG